MEMFPRICCGGARFICWAGGAAGRRALNRDPAEAAAGNAWNPACGREMGCRPPARPAGAILSGAVAGGGG